MLAWAVTRIAHLEGVKRAAPILLEGAGVRHECWRFQSKRGRHPFRWVTSASTVLPRCSAAATAVCAKIFTIVERHPSGGGSVEEKLAAVSALQYAGKDGVLHLL